MATSPPGHSVLPDRQSRLTLVMLDDRTSNTTSTTTTTPLTKVSRLESADNANNTKVDAVVEIGTNGVTGGVVHLGSFKGSFNRQATSTKLLGLMTSKKQSATPGVTTTWSYPDFSAAEFDYVRLFADQSGTVFGAAVGLDAVIDKPKWAAKVGGNTMESYDFVGKHLLQIDGYPISKAYVVLSGDVTSANVPLSSTFFGALNTATSGAEIPKRVPIPASSQSPSALYASGRVNFLKVVRVLSANATINGLNYFTGNLVRYRENQDYLITAAGFSSAGAQSNVTCTVGGTNYAGPELIVGASIVVDIGGANQETCTITAVGTNTISFTTAQTHVTTGITVALLPTTGRVAYNPLNGKMICGDTLVAGDTWRVLFASNDTSSVPKTIATSAFDTADAAGIPGRTTPVTLNAAALPVHIQDASIDVGGLSRKEVQGIGDDEVTFGTAGVPAITYALSAIATDNSLLANLSGGTNASNIYSADYAVRYLNQNAQPFQMLVKSPLSNAKVLFTITGGQPVFQYDESGAANAETSVKLSGQDLAGTIVVSATT